MADEKLDRGDVPVKQVVCAVVRDSAGRVLMVPERLGRTSKGIGNCQEGMWNWTNHWSPLCRERCLKSSGSPFPWGKNWRERSITMSREISS